MQQLLHLINDEEPRPPRYIEPAIPADLETIVLKAMAKEPAARYQKVTPTASKFYFRGVIARFEIGKAGVADAFIACKPCFVRSAGFSVALGDFCGAEFAWMGGSHVLRSVIQDGDGERMIFLATDELDSL